MLKGGVIMDVVTAEQARIAEDAGAVAVMALERVPADIRRDGGVARMSDVSLIKDIMSAVSIPVMPTARSGHFVEAQVLEALVVDYVDDTEFLTPADAALMVQLGADGNFVGSGIFKSDDPLGYAEAIVAATTYYDKPEIVAEVSAGLGKAMGGIDVATLPREELLASRGW